MNYPLLELSKSQLDTAQEKPALGDRAVNRRIEPDSLQGPFGPQLPCD